MHHAVFGISFLIHVASVIVIMCSSQSSQFTSVSSSLSLSLLSQSIAPSLFHSRL